MSFAIEVTVADGQPSVSATGDVPDGHFTVNGHEDDSQQTLTVTRRDTNGRYRQLATSTHYKEG